MAGATPARLTALTPHATVAGAPWSKTADRLDGAVPTPSVFYLIEVVGDTA